MLGLREAVVMMMPVRAETVLGLPVVLTRGTQGFGNLLGATELVRVLKSSDDNGPLFRCPPLAR